MTKQEAAARAVDAGTVAAQAVNDYGIGSAEAYSALAAADALMVAAQAQGCTKADFDIEQQRRR
ncbi:hypothetical protein OH540_09430 [Streptomyces sp. BPPL-273]|uniref:hypothetical protein n=1 Tax=Streptomyces sp. BPPL-273 TaxID=2987533 RepID=UPI0024AEC19D|nr:hypothetical protein [Streptomyces sp. BPPL-273]WHM30243.1 hypothetical protein OH540_09430 [Streptomyces sp. BPPL-273]